MTLPHMVLLSVSQHRYICLSSFVYDPVPGIESAPLNMTLKGLTSNCITDPFNLHVGMALISYCFVKGIRQDWSFHGVFWARRQTQALKTISKQWGPSFQEHIRKECWEQDRIKI